MIFKHDGPPKLRLGIVLAHEVDATTLIPELIDGIFHRLSGLQACLGPLEDGFRAVVRDVFRNGSYKPAGRAKPASEYLLRTAIEGEFPRINTLVDCCNMLSIQSLLPISIWDVDSSGAESFEFRLGGQSESYVFNHAGHSIDLEDLIVGCSVEPNGISTPIVNPVKDSMGTKTSSSTLTVAAAVYAPLDDGPVASLVEVCESFVRILGQSSGSAKAVFRILKAGEQTKF